MKPAAGILMTMALVACGPSITGRAPGADGGAGDCAVDGDCPDGMLCEGCGDGSARQCVPGCRTDAQCGLDRVCVHQVLCLTCPCPSGWCELDPCLDADRDGFIPNKDVSIVCPGKERGDCDDSNPAVFPGAREQCHNWADDDCNGKRDAQDPACQAQCASGVYTCNAAYDCRAGADDYCDRGCCAPCPVAPPPLCSPGLCPLPGGNSPDTGCALPAVCGECGSCPSALVPVCATNGSTYDNACLLAQAGATEAHDGACRAGEGLSCNGYVVGTKGPCAWGQYCRDSCPANALCLVEDLRCTSTGVCLQDSDCPAGLYPPLCDGGVATLRCVAHACVPSCP